MNYKDMVINNTIFKGYGGSYAYGTNIEGSDIDIRGLFIAERKFNFAFSGYDFSQINKFVLSLYMILKL